MITAASKPELHIIKKNSGKKYELKFRYSERYYESNKSRIAYIDSSA